MTVMNAHVTPDRVLLCSDTAVVLPDRPTRGAVSKIFYLPHANLAMAGRGVQAFTLGLFQGAWARQISNLDQLEELWTCTALDDFFLNFPKMMQQSGHGAGDLAAAEVLVAGLSHRRNRMTALHFVKEATSPFQKIVRDGGLIAPAPDQSTPPVMDSITAMADLARRQIADWAKRAPQEGFGGRLVIADIRRDTASFTTHDL